MTVFARDLDTGMARWGMQMTPHDEWDYDGINEVILFDKGGKTYAWHHDRNGFAYTWVAATGTLVAAEKVHPFVNWASDIDMESGVPNKLAEHSTHQDYNSKYA
jgi:glucose dehydrogenase